MAYGTLPMLYYTYQLYTWQATLYTGSSVVQDAFKLTVLKKLVASFIITHIYARLTALPHSACLISQIEFRILIAMNTPHIWMLKIMRMNCLMWMNMYRGGKAKETLYIKGNDLYKMCAHSYTWILRFPSP